MITTTDEMLPVLYHDNHYIAVAKSAGMFVHRTDMDRRQRQVVMQSVRDLVRRPVYVIHRLDRPTSGVVLLGLCSESAAAAAKCFRSRQVEKTYLGLVRGWCPSTGRIDRPLKDPFSVSDELRPALTRYTIQQSFDVPLCSGPFPTTRCSLVEIRPHTGRFHQIRRHLNGINHPVIGDTSHGDGRQNRFFRSQLGVSRLMLHAAQLCFRQPFTGHHIQIDCLPPDDFAAPISALQPFAVSATPEESAVRGRVTLLSHRDESFADRSL